MASQGACSIKARPVLLSIKPQDGVGGCVPRPKKLSEASMKMAFPSQMEAIIKIGAVTFGASVASRKYSNAKGDHVEVQITGDSAMVMQFAALFQNPQIAGAMGKLVRVGNQRAIQNNDGDVNMVIANKFLVTVQGSADAAAKLAFAQAVDVAKLSKM